MFKKFGLLSLFCAASLFASSYSVDNTHSEIGFKVKHMMVSSVSGNFTNFEGSFDYDSTTNSLIQLSGNVATNTINTHNTDRDIHLKTSDFFDVKNFDKIYFKSKSIKGDKVIGDLTIKNITKEVVFSLESSNIVKDSWGKNRASFKLNGEINRLDFGLTYNKVIESGGVAIGDTVNFNIEVEGIAN